MTNSTNQTPIPGIRSKLDSGDVRQLVQIIDIREQRELWEHIAAGSDQKHAAVAEEMLGDLPEVTALDALAAETELSRLVGGRRWIRIMRARAHGATWEEVGQAMRLSAEEARAWYAKRIAFQAEYAGDFHNAAEAEAAL